MQFLNNCFQSLKEKVCTSNIVMDAMMAREETRGEGYNLSLRQLDLINEDRTKNIYDIENEIDIGVYNTYNNLSIFYVMLASLKSIMLGIFGVVFAPLLFVYKTICRIKGVVSNMFRAMKSFIARKRS